MASGPWDNVQLAGPPNGPAWVNSAAQMMGATSNAVGSAVDAYQQGQNFKYQQQQRNFFQDPNNQQLLSRFMQQPDQQNYGQLMQKMAQTGGLQTAGPLIDQYLGISQDQAIANRIGGGSGQPVSTGPATNSSASSPENIHGNFSQPRIPVSQPNNFGTGSDEGPDTVRSLVAGLASGKPVSTATINNYARSLGVSPDADLSEDQAERAQRIISNSLAKQGVSAPTPNRGGTSPVAQSGIGDQESQKASGGNEIPSRMGEGSSAMSPRQTSGQGNIRAAAPPPSAIANDGLEDRRNVKTAFDDRFNASYGNQGTRPTPIGDMAKVDALNARITRLRADAAAYARRSPKAAEQADKSADDLVKERDKILESISKFNEPGRETRDIQSGATQAKIGMESEAKRRLKIEEGNIEEGRKNLTSIDKTGDDYRLSNQKVQLAKSLLMSPDFYSGPAEGINRSFKQWSATLGGDPNKGTPQEAFNKTVSDLLSEQIRTMAASGVGRVLLSEVQQMQKGIASLGVTPASNRLLLEEVDRVQQAHIQVQNLAHQYLQTHQYLDPQFNKQVADYFTQHPLFSDRELRNPKLIAPARMPQNIAQDPVRIKQWARNNGLKSGDPFAGQDGSGPYKLPAI